MRTHPRTKRGSCPARVDTGAGRSSGTASPRVAFRTGSPGRSRTTRRRSCHRVWSPDARRAPGRWCRCAKRTALMAGPPSARSGRGVQLVQHVAEAGHEAVEPAGLVRGRGGPGGSRRSRPVRLRPAAHARHAGPPRSRPGSPLGEAAPEDVGDLGPCSSGPRHMPGMLAHREAGRARHWARRPRRKSAISARAAPARGTCPACWPTAKPAGLAIGRGGPGGSRRSRPVRLRPAAHARHAGPPRSRPGSPLGEAAPEEVGDLGPCGSGPRHMPGMLRNGCVAPGCSRRRKPASAAGRDDRPPDGRRRRPVEMVPRMLRRPESERIGRPRRRGMRSARRVGVARQQRDEIGQGRTPPLVGKSGARCSGSRL
jgi:hypothetical protein